MIQEDPGFYYEGAILYVLSTKYPNGATEDQISVAINDLSIEEQIEAHKIGMRLKGEGYGEKV